MENRAFSEIRLGRERSGDRGRMRQSGRVKNYTTCSGCQVLGLVYGTIVEKWASLEATAFEAISVAGFKVTLEKPVNGYSFSDIPATVRLPFEILQEYDISLSISVFFESRDRAFLDLKYALSKL